MNQIQLENYLNPSADSSGAFVRKFIAISSPKIASEQNRGTLYFIFITNPSADFMGLDLIISS